MTNANEQPTWEAIAAAEWVVVDGAGTMGHYVSDEFEGTLYVNFKEVYAAEAFAAMGTVRNWAPNVLAWAVYQTPAGKLHNYVNPGC